MPLKTARLVKPWPDSESSDFSNQILFSFYSADPRHARYFSEQCNHGEPLKVGDNGFRVTVSLGLIATQRTPPILLKQR
jgi:hypothetical protein